MRYIIVWKKKDNTYYYRKVRGSYTNYYIGYENQYGHEIICIIDYYKEFEKPISFRKRVIRKIISLLQKFDKKI